MELLRQGSLCEVEGASRASVNNHPGSLNMDLISCWQGLFCLPLSVLREMPLSVSVGKWDACVMLRGERILCLKPTWSHWANLSTCLLCWMSWRTWSAVWRMTIQHIRGELRLEACGTFTQRGPVSALQVVGAYLLCAKVITSVDSKYLSVLGLWVHASMNKV